MAVDELIKIHLSFDWIKKKKSNLKTKQQKQVKMMTATQKLMLLAPSNNFFCSSQLPLRGTAFFYTSKMELPT